jgi:hypothetical protein
MALAELYNVGSSKVRKEVGDATPRLPLDLLAPVLLWCPGEW